MTSLIISILVLQSRTAYLGTAIFLISNFLNSHSKKNLVTKSHVKAFNSIWFLFLLIAFFYQFKIKEGSTSGRMLILENIFKILPTTFFGKGVGSFPLFYNEQCFLNQLHNRGYINMAYNDFLELYICNLP